MQITSTLPRTGLILISASALVASIGVVATQQADAGERCGTTVTGLNQLSKQRFAGGSTLKRFRASVDYPGAGGWVDQTAKALYGVYPSTATPELLNARVGDRATIGSQVQSQQPQALAAINGDFFLFPNIGGKEVEVARGPMVKDGKIIRADRSRLRTVGLDSSGKPFGGLMGVRGNVQAGAGAVTDIAGVNWHKVQGGGATIFTVNWSASSGSPRPAGDSEWVINGRNKIKEVRTPTKNANARGNPVASGTRVIAFPSNLALVGAAGVVGQKVRVRIRQSTDTGVTLHTAIGRGLPLVENGVAAPMGCAAYNHSKAARPRTVIGWTKRGAWRTMTVPGTHFDGVGLRLGGLGLANEAVLAKKLGMHFAYELDGGGSTTWYTRSNAGNWSRRDLYGVTGGNYERAVTNGIAFVN